MLYSFRLHSVYEQQANDPTVKDKGCLFIDITLHINGQMTSCEMLKIMFLLLSSDANLQPKQFKQDLVLLAKNKIERLSSADLAEFHKYAQLAECPLICIDAIGINGL